MLLKPVFGVMDLRIERVLPGRLIAKDYSPVGKETETVLPGPPLLLLNSRDDYCWKFYDKVAPVMGHFWNQKNSLKRRLMIKNGPLSSFTRLFLHTSQNDKRWKIQTSKSLLNHLNNFAPAGNIL